MSRFFFFKQKTAYEMRISYWSSDVALPILAIVTGRRSEEVAAFLDLPHVMYVGLYGFEEQTPELLTAVVPLVETAAARVPDAWIEDKESRTEERRVGKGCVSTCRSRWWPHH